MRDLLYDIWLNANLIVFLDKKLGHFRVICTKWDVLKVICDWYAIGVKTQERVLDKESFVNINDIRTLLRHVIGILLESWNVLKELGKTRKSNTKWKYCELWSWKMMGDNRIDINGSTWKRSQWSNKKEALLGYSLSSQHNY